MTTAAYNTTSAVRRDAAHLRETSEFAWASQ